MAGKVVADMQSSGVLESWSFLGIAIYKEEIKNCVGESCGGCEFLKGAYEHECFPRLLSSSIAAESGVFFAKCYEPPSLLRRDVSGMAPKRNRLADAG